MIIISILRTNVGTMNFLLLWQQRRTAAPEPTVCPSNTLNEQSDDDSPKIGTIINQMKISINPNPSFR
jgi:hypothetical protein